MIAGPGQRPFMGELDCVLRYMPRLRPPRMGCTHECILNALVTTLPIYRMGHGNTIASRRASAVIIKSVPSARALGEAVLLPSSHLFPYCRVIAPSMSETL